MLLRIVFFVLFIEESLGLKCNFCMENDFAKKRGINEFILRDLEAASDRYENHTIDKRSVDPTFKGKPKTKAEYLSIKFNVSDTNFDQSSSLVNLLNKIAVEYLDKCPPFILYDKFVENSEFFIVQKLFKSFPMSFYHGKINEKFEVENRYLLQSSDENCRSYILFLSDPLMARKIIGPQIKNKVIVVARSSQWRLQDFLSSEHSSDIVNLLVIGESLTSDSKREKPYVLYTHRLYADGLGSNIPVVLTSWIQGVLSRPKVNLFPKKFSAGFSGHRFLVTAVNQPPFIFRTKYVDQTGMTNVRWEGVEFRLLHLLSKMLNFTFEIVEPLNVAALGSGEAVCEDVARGRADIGMAGAYITEDRLQKIDLSVGHSRDCAAFITLASKALPKYRAIMGPFQWPVWVALTAVYLLAIFPLAYSDKLTLSHVIGNIGEIENMFWYVFGTFTNSLSFTGKYSWSKSEKLSTRLLIGFYWVFTIIITACYTGSIIAFVTLPTFPDTVDSVNDMLGLFFRVSTLDRGGWERWFVNSTHIQTAKLYKKMEYVGSLDEGISNVTKSFFWNYAFLGSRAQLEYLVQSNFSADGFSKRSALHLSEECFASFEVAFAFPKHAVYTTRINEAIERVMQSGVVAKLSNEVKWKMQRSSTGRLLQAGAGNPLKEIIREERQLTTADTEGMFLLMGAGYLIGALVLISEVIGGFTNKCRQIIKRSKKSAVSHASSRNSADITQASEMKAHLKRKALRAEQKQAPKSRFPGLDELNLTRATLKELYGGYRKKDPNIIIQNGEMMLETEAVSEGSSIDNILDKSDEKTEASDETVFQHEVMIHNNGDEDDKIDLDDLDAVTEIPDHDDESESNLDEITQSDLASDDPYETYTPQALEKIDELCETVDFSQNEQFMVEKLPEDIDETFGEPVVSPDDSKTLYPFTN